MYKDLSTFEFCNTMNACSGGREFATTYNTMSEVWDKCHDPTWLRWIVDHLKMPISDSTWRKIACAYIRETKLPTGKRIWDHLKDERSRKAVEIAEKYAKGEASAEELSKASENAWNAASELWEISTLVERSAARAAASAASSFDKIETNVSARSHASVRNENKCEMKIDHANIFRKYIPNPFRVS